jgi:cbb3-type cytochrome oxidase maturation protein
MKIMLFLILVSLLLAAGFLLAYLRAASNGQFDDEYTPAIRMLFDDKPIDSARLTADGDWPLPAEDKTQKTIPDNT